MNKYLILSITSACAITLSGCFSTYKLNTSSLSELTTYAITEPAFRENAAPNPMWNEASPETSALTFYVYNEEAAAMHTLFNNSQTKEILSTLSGSAIVPLEKWSPDDISFPVYGINICKKDGSPLSAVWTNGFLILNDGTSYEFELDTSSWENIYDFEYSSEFSDISALPCADCLLRTETGWNFDIMTEAVITEEIPQGITMEPVSADGNSITVRYSNHTDERYDWMYGTSFVIHAENNGKWYSLPTASDANYGFASIGLVLMPDQPNDETYSTDMYGTLPDGHYRLYANGLYVEFDMNGNTITLPDLR